MVEMLCNDISCNMFCCGMVCCGMILYGQVRYGMFVFMFCIYACMDVIVVLYCHAMPCDGIKFM